MASGNSLKVLLLKDVLTAHGYIRGPFGSALRRVDMLDSGTPVYEQQNAIYDNREFRYYIDNEKLSELSRFLVKPGDIVISCSGTVGKTTLIKDTDPVGIISQALLLLRVDSKVIRPKYLQYFFMTNEGFNSLVERSHGSVQANIAKREIVESIELKVPSLSVQDRVITILNSFNNTLAVLNRINDNLSCQYDSIFKHYFGLNRITDRSTVYDKHFSDVLIESKEKDESKMLPEYSVTNTGIKPRSDTFKKNLSEKTINKVVRKGNLVIGMSRTILNWGIMKEREGSVSPAYSVFVLKDGIDPDYIEGYINNNIQYFHEILKPSTREGQSLDKGALMDRVLIYPKEYEIVDFHKHSDCIIQQIAINNDEICELTTIRDALLPRLISGEIDVSTLEIPN